MNDFLAQVPTPWRDRETRPEQDKAIQKSAQAQTLLRRLLL